MEVNIGIEAEARAAIIENLEHVLADTYTLYLKTHNFHWNVTGPMFNDLHAMFMAQYTEMWAAVDQIAERIRSLGAFAPGSYSEFAELTSIPQTSGRPDDMGMLRQLLEGHEVLIRTARAGVKPAAEAGDESTADLLTERLRIHEKTAWMLRSMLA